MYHISCSVAAGEGWVEGTGQRGATADFGRSREYRRARPCIRRLGCMAMAAGGLDRFLPHFGAEALAVIVGGPIDSLGVQGCRFRAHVDSLDHPENITRPLRQDATACSAHIASKQPLIASNHQTAAIPRPLEMRWAHSPGECRSRDTSVVGHHRLPTSAGSPPPPSGSAGPRLRGRFPAKVGGAQCAKRICGDALGIGARLGSRQERDLHGSARRSEGGRAILR